MNDERINEEIDEQIAYESQAYIYETYTDILKDAEINSIFKTLEAACKRVGREFPQDKELIIGVRAES